MATFLYLGLLRPPGCSLYSHMVSEHVRERPRTFQAAPHYPAPFPAPPTATLLAPPTAAPPSPQASQIFALIALPIFANTEAPQKVQFPPKFIAPLPAETASSQFQVPAEAVETLDEAGIIEDFLASLEGKGDEDVASPLLQDTHSKSLATAPLLATQACAQQAIPPLTGTQGSNKSPSTHEHTVYFEANNDASADIALLMHANFDVGHAHEDEDLAMAEAMATQARNATTAHLDVLVPISLKVPSSLSSLHLQYHTYCTVVLHTQHCDSYLKCISQSYWFPSKHNPIYVSQDQFSCLHLKHESVPSNAINSISSYKHVNHESLSFHALKYFIQLMLSFMCFIHESLTLSHAWHLLSHSHEMPFTLMHAQTSSSSHPIMHENPSLIFKPSSNSYFANFIIIMGSQPQPLETSSNQALNNAAMAYAPLMLMSSLIQSLKDPSMPNLKATHVITRGGVLAHSQSIKESQDAVRHGDARLKDGVDAALSKVKMKTFILIIYGVTITLDPG